MKVRGVWGFIGLLGASAVVGVCACSGTAIDVGPRGGGESGSSGLGGTPGTGGSSLGDLTCTDLTPLPEWPSPDDCAGSNDSPLVGRWHGYLENEAAPWDELFLDIKGANSSGLCGTFTAGNMGPPPSPSDPAEIYPPGASVVRVGPGAILAGSPLISGYASTLLHGKLDGTRIRFGISPVEGYRGWCKLQTSYEAVGWGGAGGGPSRACRCSPGGDATVHPAEGECSSVTFTNAGVSTTLGCYQQAQCGTYLCACNAAGCDAVEDSVNSFDLTANGADSIEGSDTAHPGKRIHFTRMP